jgi:hypothetical protein
VKGEVPKQFILGKSFFFLLFTSPYKIPEPWATPSEEEKNHTRETIEEEEKN